MTTPLPHPIRDTPDFHAGVAFAAHTILHAVGHAHGAADLSVVAAAEPNTCCQDAVMGFALGIAEGFEEMYGVTDQGHAHGAAGRHDPHPGHPEDHCHRCGGPNVPWSAPSPLWNEVMRGGSINGSEQGCGIVCPTCFAVAAEGRGIASLWRLSAERVEVALETVTPSGRVWDAQAWMFVDPPSGAVAVTP